MTTGEFKYEVAFSFLQEDEALAKRLDDLIKDRLKTFLYTKAQEKLAGHDGEEIFNAVFGNEARLVVVLYRAKWGTTPWTRIEETAIRNRGHAEGYDFTLFIPLDDPPAVPRWLPVTRIYYYLKRFGEAGAAAIIVERVTQQGGVARVETLAENAARFERERQFATERHNFLGSFKGAEAALKQFRATFVSAKNALKRHTPPSLRLSLREDGDRYFAIFGDSNGRGIPVSVSMGWRVQYGNSLNASQLDMQAWEGHPPWRASIRFDKPKSIGSRRFHFDLTEAGETWTESGGHSFTAEALGEECLRWLLEHEQKRHGK